MCDDSSAGILNALQAVAVIVCACALATQLQCDIQIAPVQRTLSLWVFQSIPHLPSASQLLPVNSDNGIATSRYHAAASAISAKAADWLLATLETKGSKYVPRVAFFSGYRFGYHVLLSTEKSKIKAATLSRSSPPLIRFLAIGAAGGRSQPVSHACASCIFSGFAMRPRLSPAPR